MFFILTILVSFLSDFDSVLIKENTYVSIYTPWVRSWHVPYARYPFAWNNKPTKEDLVCAHRTIPLGSILRLTKGGLSVVCLCADRGPYGACVPNDFENY